MMDMATTATAFSLAFLLGLVSMALVQHWLDWLDRR